MDDFITRLNRRLLKETAPAPRRTIRLSPEQLLAMRLRQQEARLLALRERDLKLSIRLNQEELAAEQEKDLGISTDTQTGGTTRPRK